MPVMVTADVYVNRSADDVAEMAPPEVTVTSKEPAVPAGDTAVI